MQKPKHISYITNSPWMSLFRLGAFISLGDTFETSSFKTHEFLFWRICMRVFQPLPSISYQFGLHFTLVNGKIVKISGECHDWSSMRWVASKKHILHRELCLKSLVISADLSLLRCYQIAFWMSQLCCTQGEIYGILNVGLLFLKP